MLNNSELTLTQQQARLGVFACAFIIAAVYFFELSKEDINKPGEVKEIVGTITRCSAKRDANIKVSSSSKMIYIFMDATGDNAYSYSHPKSFRNRVLDACNTKARVQMKYRPYKPLLKDWTGYTVVSLIDDHNDKPYFTFYDYLDWAKQNRQYALIAGGLASLALVYLVLVWLGFAGNRDVNKVKQSIHYGIDNDDALLIKSSERNGDSWAFLILFSGLTVWLLMEVISGSHYGWLFAAAVFLLAAYAYLVEVANSNYFTIDHKYFVTYSKPLPWINKPIVISVKDIDYFIGRDQIHSSSHGPILQYSVSVQLLNEDEETHLFHTKDLAEAEAVAELGNEKLDRLN